MAHATPRAQLPPDQFLILGPFFVLLVMDMLEGVAFETLLQAQVLLWMVLGSEWLEIVR